MGFRARAETRVFYKQATLPLGFLEDVFCKTALIDLIADQVMVVCVSCCLACSQKNKPVNLTASTDACIHGSKQHDQQLAAKPVGSI